jgi:hypothetical protein
VFVALKFFGQKIAHFGCVGCKDMSLVDYLFPDPVIADVVEDGLWKV